MAQRSLVPKFGNWDGDNVPYTVYFENARKEKGGIKMNPNDPEENPEAFMSKKSNPSQSQSQLKIQNHQKNLSQKSLNSESGSEISNAESYSNHNRMRSDRKKSINGGSSGNILCPPSPGPPQTPTRGASVPMFGAWDERDPKSGEGFTVIFNKVKEEKHIAASTFPRILPSQQNIQVNPQQTHYKKSKRCCCCLF